MPQVAGCAIAIKPITTGNLGGAITGWKSFRRFMPLTLNTRRLEQNVRVTTDLDRATADRLRNEIQRMQCTRAEFMRALVHAYLNDRERQ